ncbi:response regulator [Larkinella rosea]|nr:hypothetical protein [Larkinella rosea]
MKDSIEYKTILIVEDEVINIKIDRYAISRYFVDINILTATNLGDAARVVNQNHIDAIILDTIFPEGENNLIPLEYKVRPGILFLRHIRNLNELKNIPVLCTSRGIDKVLISEINSLDASFIMRPYNVTEFVNILIEMLYR